MQLNGGWLVSKYIFNISTIRHLILRLLFYPILKKRNTEVICDKVENKDYM